MHNFAFPCLANPYGPSDALQTCIPTHIRGVVPGMIDGHPSRGVLEMLEAMVQNDNCANVCMEILMNSCGADGRKIAEQLAARPQ